MSQNRSCTKLQGLSRVFALMITFGFIASLVFAQTTTPPPETPLTEEELQLQVETLRNQLKDEQRKLRNAENQNQALALRIAELQQDLEEHKQRIGRIQQTNSKLFKDITEAEELITRLEQRIVEYAIDNTNLEFEKDNLEMRVFNLETLEKHYRKEAAFYENEISTIKNEFNVREQTHENLFTSLKESLNSDKIKVSDLTDHIIVRLEDNLLFDSGKAFIKSTGFSTLNKIGRVLKQISNKHIQVEGHTDNLPITGDLKAKYPTNWELSSARATAVARYLVNVIKINPNRISSTGFGSHQPIADNSKESGRELNRRVEFALFPLRYSDFE